MLKERKSIKIDVNRIVKILGVIITILVSMCIVVQTLRFAGGYSSKLGLIPQFIVGQENNVPTYFSSVILLISSVLLLIIAFRKYEEDDDNSLHWLTLSIIFLCLSLDEAASFHELMNLPVMEVLESPGIFQKGWVIAAVIALSILLLFYVKFLYSIKRRSAILFFTAGAIYVGGAIGGEITAAYYSDLQGWENPVYATINTVEETFEMVGILIFIYALMDYIKAEIGSIQIEFV